MAALAGHPENAYTHSSHSSFSYPSTLTAGRVITASSRSGKISAFRLHLTVSSSQIRCRASNQRVAISTSTVWDYSLFVLHASSSDPVTASAPSKLGWCLLLARRSPFPLKSRSRLANRPAFAMIADAEAIFRRYPCALNQNSGVPSVGLKKSVAIAGISTKLPLLITCISARTPHGATAPPRSAGTRKANNRIRDFTSLCSFHRSAQTSAESHMGSHDLDRSANPCHFRFLLSFMTRDPMV